MKTRILSGKEVANQVYDRLGPTLERLKGEGIIPGLAAILVGNDPASEVYVRNKTRTFKKLGLFSKTFRFPSGIGQDELIGEIRALNRDPTFHGILVQLPLPEHLNSDEVLYEVSPEKDVDGFHPENLGRLALGKPRMIPCTPKGILAILNHYGIPTDGRHAVVVGRSSIVGRPVSLLLGLKKSTGNATVTVCHSRTPDLGHFTRQADIIIAAVGEPGVINKDMISAGVTLIDVGITRVEDKSEKGYHLRGDVDAESVIGLAGALTPVPGGVGPMTIAMLVENTVETAISLHSQG